MNEHRIENFIDFHRLIERYDARTVIYRGVKSVRFPLLPKIGRVIPPDSVASREKNEQEILRLFKERAFQYLDFTPPERLGLARRRSTIWTAHAPVGLDRKSTCRLLLCRP